MHPAVCYPYKQSLSTPVTLQHLSWEKASLFTPWDPRSLGPLQTWSQLFGVAGKAVWTCHRDGMEHYWVYLCQAQRGLRRELRDCETVKWELGHFPCKEIKVKRKIKVWFPASWFVFCTEIPFFPSDFAETTIAPLPVLVTMTLLTLSLGGGHCYIYHGQVIFQLPVGSVLKYCIIASVRMK